MEIEAADALREEAHFILTVPVFLQEDFARLGRVFTPPGRFLGVELDSIDQP